MRKSQRSTNVRGPLPHDDDHLACGCRDLGSAARAGQSCGRVLVVADDRRVDVAVPVELRAAEEADVDASGLQPVGEDLGHRLTTASAVSASSPSPIDSGSRVGFEPMQPDS